MLSLATSAFGRALYSTSQDGTGVFLRFKSDAQITTGFDATFYYYNGADDTTFFESGYSTRPIRTSVGGVTEPNF